MHSFLVAATVLIQSNQQEGIPYQYSEDSYFAFEFLDKTYAWAPKAGVKTAGFQSLFHSTLIRVIFAESKVGVKTK